MQDTSEPVRNRAAQLAREIAAWLEREQIAARLLDAYASQWGEASASTAPAYPRERLAQISQELLLVTARSFFLWSTFHFRRKYLWFFRRPDWELLGAAWEGFLDELGPRLDAEQKDFLESVQLSSSLAAFEPAAPDLGLASRLIEALDPMRGEPAYRVAKKFLPQLERKVNELATGIFGS